MMLYKVTVLLCSMVATPNLADCNRDTAIAVKSVSGFAVEEAGDKGAWRCSLVGARSATILIDQYMSKWFLQHPDKSSSDFPRDLVKTKILCEPHHEWLPPNG